MNFKALVTRQIGFGDESIRVNITDEDNFDTFKEKVDTALAVTDYRVHELGFRLFEDTDLVSTLTQEEKNYCEQAARLLFPKTTLENTSILKSGVQFEFRKITAIGEDLTVQIHDIDSYDNLNTVIEDTFKIIDKRLIKKNTEQLSHLEYIKNLDYATKLKVVMVMDILYGRATLDGVLARLNENTEEEYIQEQIKVLNNINTVNNTNTNNSN